MKISLLQTDLHWEDRAANLSQIASALEEVPADSGVILLPEMFSTAFSSRSDALSEPMDGDTVQAMQRWAQKRNAVVAGSLMISEGGSYRNRFLWVRPDGSIAHYDKRHLFRMAGEHEHFAAGEGRSIVEHEGWRIMLQVCYDLRFPVFARNRYHEGRYDYDLILYVANWPSPRHNAWETLLRARAIENLSYCIGVNRIGEDAKRLSYKGGSAIIDFMGNPICEAGAASGVYSAELALDPLRCFREKFPTGMDADAFSLKA